MMHPVTKFLIQAMSPSIMCPNSAYLCDAAGELLLRLAHLFIQTRLSGQFKFIRNWLLCNDGENVTFLSTDRSFNARSTFFWWSVSIRNSCLAIVALPNYRWLIFEEMRLYDNQDHITRLLLPTTLP